MASEIFKEECNNRAFKNRFGRIIVNPEGEIFSGSDKLQKLVVDSGCYINGEFVGNVYSKKVTAEFVDSIGNVFLNKEVNVEVGVKYDNNTTEFLSLGKYTIDKPTDETTNNHTSIVGYDNLLNNIDKEYKCGLDYSNQITLADLFLDLCNNLNLSPKSLTFTNSDFIITSNPFMNGEKNRVVLQSIEKVSCTFSLIDPITNQLELCWFNQNENPSCIFTKKDYAELKGGKVKYGPINTLVVKNSVIGDENISKSDQNSIDNNGEHQFVISEDYILNTADKRVQALDAIWSKINGFEYIDYELTTYYGKPFIKLGNKIRIYQTDDSYFDSYVLNHIFTFDGAFSSILKAQSLTEQQISTKQDISLGELLGKTQIEIDKANKKITMLVTDNEKISKEIEAINESVEVFRADLETNNIVISVDATNKPLNTNEYEIKYSAYYLGKLVSVVPTTDDKHTGIELTIENGNIIFKVDKNNVISVLDNKYTFVFQYKNSEEELYTINRVIYVSLITKGETGESGVSVSISKSEISYQLGNSGTIVPTGTWNNSIPTLTKGMYLWTKNYVKYSDGTETNSYSVSYISKDGVNGQDGADGKDGVNGQDGVGIKTTIIEYQKSNNAIDIPDTWLNEIPTLSSGDCLWTKTTIKYSDSTESISYSVGMLGMNGVDGKDGVNGKDGTNGIDGKDAAIQSETAPEDTSQLWLDITTDELKRHVNGEWCVINDYSSELDSIKQQLNDSTKDLNTKIGNVNNAIEEVTTTYNSMLTETAKGWEANLNKVTETVTANNDAVNKRIDEINDYLTYQIETVDGRETGVLTIGTSDSDIKLKLVNNIVYFEQSGHRVAYISNNKLYITDAEFLNSMRIGNFNFVPRSNGSLDFKKAGD